jgi:hypothetical protein
MDFKYYGSNDWFATTLTFTDVNDSKRHEPNADSPLERFESLKMAKQQYGIKTWASIEPVIDPQQSLALIEETAPYVDLFKIGKLNHADSPHIDWRTFAAQAIELCENLGVRYFIKIDLAKHLMSGVCWKQTDNRRIEEK